METLLDDKETGHPLKKSTPIGYQLQYCLKTIVKKGQTTPTQDKKKGGIPPFQHPCHFKSPELFLISKEKHLIQ
jgi:hypothetical protein